MNRDMEKLGDREKVLACTRLARMLVAKMDTDELTQVEMAAQIQFYADDGVVVNEHHLGSYIRGVKNKKYNFPTLGRLKAIGLYLGYELEEFHNLLFEEIERNDKKSRKTFVSEIFSKMEDLEIDEKIYLHRCLGEDIYRKVLL